MARFPPGISLQITEGWGILRRNGFSIVDLFFRGYDFAGILAVK